MCRQVIREFCALEMPILLVPGQEDEEGVKEPTLGELLPMSFGPEHLEMPRS